MYQVTIRRKYDRTLLKSSELANCSGNLVAIAGVKTATQVRQNAGALGWKLNDDDKLLS